MTSNFSPRCSDLSTSNSGVPRNQKVSRCNLSSVSSVVSCVCVSCDKLIFSRVMFVISSACLCTRAMRSSSAERAVLMAKRGRGERRGNARGRDAGAAEARSTEGLISKQRVATVGPLRAAHGGEGHAAYTRRCPLTTRQSSLVDNSETLTYPTATKQLVPRNGAAADVACCITRLPVSPCSHVLVAAEQLRVHRSFRLPCPCAATEDRSDA